MCQAHFTRDSDYFFAELQLVSFGYKMVGGRLRTSFVCASVGVGMRLKGWSAHTFAMRGSNIEEVMG